MLCLRPVIIIARINGGYSNAAAKSREWLRTLTQDQIPRDQFETVYSRSSGPGGQNVNKVNSKVTIKMDSHAWRTTNWVPDNVKIQLVPGKFPYITKTGVILVSSQRTRDRLTNLDDCFHKLCNAIKVTAYFPAERDLDDIKRWDDITKRTNEQRLLSKKDRSNKKHNRKFKDFD
jgi:peptidyl-tRNA hydrolase ICT1